MLHCSYRIALWPEHTGSASRPMHHTFQPLCAVHLSCFASPYYAHTVFECSIRSAGPSTSSIRPQSTITREWHPAKLLARSLSGCPLGCVIFSPFRGFFFSSCYFCFFCFFRKIRSLRALPSPPLSSILIAFAINYRVSLRPGLHLPWGIQEPGNEGTYVW